MSSFPMSASPMAPGGSCSSGCAMHGLPHPPFAIAMSGFGMNADRVKSTAAGFRRHVLKPFDVDELDKILEEAGRDLWAEQQIVYSGCACPPG